MEITTTDLSKFGNRERAMAGELLTAADRGFPEDFENSEVTVMMNMNSGNVFLTNSEFQVAMMNGDKLESFYSCPECGEEGFADDIHEGDTPETLSRECLRYLKDIPGIDADDPRVKDAPAEDEVDEETEA